MKVSKGAKIRSRYNQVPHPTQDTNGKVTNSHLDTTNESQEVSPFPVGDPGEIKTLLLRNRREMSNYFKRIMELYVYDCQTLYERCLLLSYQPRVTVTTCFVNKVIRALDSIDNLSINPILWIGLIHK